MTHFLSTSDIIRLNVGGTGFASSWQTLTWIPDSFFTSILSGRMPTLKDETGAIFIDRDPKLFSVILNFLRTKEVDLKDVNISSLRHEAEYYGLAPLVKHLTLCEDLHHSTCGDVLFHGYLPLKSIPHSELSKASDSKSLSNRTHNNSTVPSETSPSTSSSADCDTSPIHGSTCFPSRKATVPPVRASETRTHSSTCSTSDLRNISCGHSSGSSLSLCHSRNSSSDLSKTVKVDFGNVLNTNGKPQVSKDFRVNIVIGHLNWIAIAYGHFIAVYRLRDSSGWQLVFRGPYIEAPIDRIALNVKIPLIAAIPSDTNMSGHLKIVAISYADQIQAWGVSEPGVHFNIGTFKFVGSVDHLFFIGSQLIALSHTGKVGVWHGVTQHWQIQDVKAISSFDTAGSFLVLGCKNGSIYYIDMQKFPLRMKDNDLLVTELYRDPSSEVITAISVYLTPKTNLSGNWIEIAYGTRSGTVCVIVQHPETVGHGPQLFQTFAVHRNPVTKVVLSEKFLISACSEYSHVRTWSVTRFRGMISTQPGSTPLASFKVTSLEDLDSWSNYSVGNDCGPHGEQDDELVFLQKVVPETDKLYVRYASTGKRVCVIKSVDGTPITAFCVHECEGSNRMGSRPRRYIFTGHMNGAIQMWDLTTALDLAAKGEPTSNLSGGPSSHELIRLVDQYDLTNSRYSSPCLSPEVHYNPKEQIPPKVKPSNVAFLNQAKAVSANNDATGIRFNDKSVQQV